MFMASSPRGTQELDYEAEELAILQAAGQIASIDLVVDDTGDPAQLGRRISTLATQPPVLHVSCHGGTDPSPTLYLEDETGSVRPTSARGLLDHLQPYKPPLMFLSACLTAAAGKAKTAGSDSDVVTPEDQTLVASLTKDLVSKGIPAVLGWSGSVTDLAAIAFARALYDRLGRGVPAPEAVAAARRELLEGEIDGVGRDGQRDELLRTAIKGTASECCRRDWHLARLWVGPSGGGSVVRQGATRKRMMHPPHHGQKRLLKVKEGEKLEVAAPEMFVGRRKELQRALATLASADRAGVLLHGMGRLGKSSLSARIADRRSDLLFAVVFKHYDARSILDAIEDAVKLAPREKEAQRQAITDAKGILDRGKEAVRENSEALEGVLHELLSGPCLRAESGLALLVLIDDMERVLVPADDGGRHVVDLDHRAVITSVLRAFEGSLGDSRLLVTSRYRFDLPSRLAEVLEPIQLAPFHDAARRKLSLRQVEDRLTDLAEDELDERKELLIRAQTLARGNPGLHDLLGLKIALNPSVPLGTASNVLNQVDAYFENGALPEDENTRAFVENLALDSLIGLTTPASYKLLSELTLFELPVPGDVTDCLSGDNHTLTALLDLGLIDVVPDLVDHTRPAYQVNRLAEGRVAPLKDAEARTIAQAVIESLYESWGGAEGDAIRPYSADIELARLAIAAENAQVVSGCAPSAIRGLLERNASAAADIGKACIALLHIKQIPISLQVRAVVASSHATAGDGHAANQLLEDGEADLQEAMADAEPGDDDIGSYLFELGIRQVSVGELDRAQVTWESFTSYMRDRPREVAIGKGYLADILEARGDLDEALRIRLEEELPVYERLGDVRSIAVTQGKVADILEARGDLDEALRIRLEEELPVYERLGDVRSIAVTRGQIADILEGRGDLDEAMCILREEALPALKRLGDVRLIAVTQSKVANILEARGDLDEALRIRLEEQLPVYERLGDVREIAVTQGQIADILKARGDLDEALRIRLEEELPVYERLGDMRSIAVTQGQIADILQGRGDLDEAMRILREEALPAFKRLGDVRSIAVAQGKVADILRAHGDLEEALRIRLEEQLPVYERLGDVRSLAVLKQRIASIYLERGDVDAFRRLQTERLETNRQLGNVDGIASAQWDLAQLDLAEQKLDDAIPRVLEAYQIVASMGRAEGVMVIGPVCAQFLAGARHFDQAYTVLDQAEAAAKTLKHPDSVQAITELRVAIKQHADDTKGT